MDINLLCVKFELQFNSCCVRGVKVMNKILTNPVLSHFGIIN